MTRLVRSFTRRRAFLQALEEGNSESKAAAMADGRLGEFKKWRDDDENFAKDWADAIEEGTDLLEDEAVARALKKSDPLMMFLLKARRPDKFDRASKLELSGGLKVEGSKATLLNKVAKLQAQRQLARGSDQPELVILDAQPEEVEGKKVFTVPDKPPERGRKRRAASEGSGRRKA